MLSANVMYEPLDDRDQTPTAPLKPRPTGKGLPVPPILPLVAVVSIFAGLAMGYGLAPKPEASEAPNAPSVVSEAPVVSASIPTLPDPGTTASEPAGSFELPPPGGLTLAEALHALSVSFGPPANVISARVGRYPAVTPGWVWLIVVPYSDFDCDYSRTARIAAVPLETASPAPCRAVKATEMVILDYLTGDFLEDRIPAG